MDAMENRTPVFTAGSNHEPENLENSGDGARLKTLLDQNILKLKLNLKQSSKLDVDLSPNFGLGNGFTAINSSKNRKGKVSDFGVKVLNGYNSYLDMGFDKEEEEMDFRGGFGVQSIDDGKLQCLKY